MEAEKYWLQAVKNGVVSTMLNLGLLYYNRGKLSEAEKYYLQAVDNGNVDAMFNLGLLYYNQGKFSEAEKYFLLAIEKNGNNAFKGLAELYYQQNINKAKAFTYIQQYKGSEDLRIVIELWNGIFTNVEKRALAVVKEEPNNLYQFIVELLIHQQKGLVLNLFNHPEVGQMLQEKYHVLYYVCLILNKNLNLKVLPEVKIKIDKEMDYIVKREKFFGYVDI